MKDILTAQLLNDEQIKRMVSTQNMAGGDDDYAAGRVTVEQVSAQFAALRVLDHRSGKPYFVRVSLNGDQLSLSCTCRDGYAWQLCRHRYAATLALRAYLTQHPPKLWKIVLDQGARTAARRATTSNSLILFSLLERSNIWSVVPYTLNVRHLEGVDLSDVQAIGTAIVEGGLAEHAKPLKSRINRDAYPLAPDAAVTAANLAVGNPYAGYGYYSGQNTAFYEAVLPYLSHCLTFIGDDGAPLQEQVSVIEQPGMIEAELKETRSGLQLVAQLVVGAVITPIKANALTVITHDPLWLLLDTTVVRVAALDGVASALLQNPTLTIPAEDQNEFFDNYLLPLSERIPVRGKTLAWVDVAAEPEPRLYLSEQEGALRAELRFDYGGYEFAHEKRAAERGVRRIAGTTSFARVARQPAREQELAQLLTSHGLKKGSEPHVFPLRANMQPIDFLLHQVPKLAEKGVTVFGEEALTSARVNRNKPTVSFKVVSGIDWFDVQAVVNFGDLTVSLKDIKQAVRKREKYIKLADGSIGALPEEWIDRYRHMLALGDATDDETLRFSQVHVTMLDQLLGEADRAQADDEFGRRREKLRNFDTIKVQPLPNGFKGELRPYQKFGYDWLHFLRDYGFGGCLADDMGVGKTVQALAYLESVYDRDNDAPASLIVMPRSLLFNWQREAEKFAPGLDVYVHADQGRISDAQQFAEHDLVLTTYGTMLRDVELLRKYEFDTVILDESQAIKNPVAETSKAARLLRGRHRLALTGTPIENSTGELWSQFAFLNPGLLGSMDYFRGEFVNPIERQQNGDTAQFLRKMVFPFILRRTKDQVAADLPPRTERILITDMEPAQQKLYVKQRDFYRAKLLGLIENGGMDDARMQVLEGLLRLRQISNHPRLVDPKFKGASGKFEALLETLDTLRAEGHRALVFSQFVQMLTLVREALDARGVPYAYLDGQTRHRETIVDSFQNDATLPFFLISLKAGGVGLNLTAADYVIHIDPWWNPAVEQQATDRTHRIGQDKPVFVTKLVARDTVEEKILLLQERKRELVAQVIGAEGGVFKSLTRDDIEVLFS